MLTKACVVGNGPSALNAGPRIDRHEHVYVAREASKNAPEHYGTRPFVNVYKDVSKATKDFLHRCYPAGKKHTNGLSGALLALSRYGGVTLYGMDNVLAGKQHNYRMWFSSGAALKAPRKHELAAERCVLDFVAREVEPGVFIWDMTRRIFEIGENYIDYDEWDESSKTLKIKREYNLEPVIEEMKGHRTAEGSANVLGSSYTHMRHIAYVPWMISHRLALEGRISSPMMPRAEDKQVVKAEIEKKYPYLKSVPWKIA